MPEVAERRAGITVRFAKSEDDALSMLELGCEAFHATRMSAHPFDEGRTMALIRKGMGNPPWK